MRTILLVSVFILFLLAACTNVEMPDPEPANVPAEELEPSVACNSNADCNKYHACKEMLCANMDEINQEISNQILEDCDIDITLYDPPGAFAMCECVENACQFI